MRLALTAAGLFVAGIVCGWWGQLYFSSRVAPVLSLATFMSADESYENGRWESAVIELYESSHWYPEWYSPDQMLGQIFVEQGYYELAAVHLAKAEEKFENPLSELFRAYPSDLEEIEKLKNLIPD